MRKSPVLPANSKKNFDEPHTSGKQWNSPRKQVSLIIVHFYHGKPKTSTICSYSIIKVFASNFDAKFKTYDSGV